MVASKFKAGSSLCLCFFLSFLNAYCTDSLGRFGRRTASFGDALALCGVNKYAELTSLPVSAAHAATAADRPHRSMRRLCCRPLSPL